MFGDLLKTLYNMLKVEEMPSCWHPLLKAYFKVWSIYDKKTSLQSSTVSFHPPAMYSLQYSLYLAHRWYSLVPRVYHEEVSTLQRAKKMTQQRQEQFWFSIFVWCSSHISQPTTRELTVENCTVVVHVFPPYYEKNATKKWKNCPTQYGWAKSMDSVTLYVLWQ